MSRNYLIVVRAGDTSLHPQWLAGPHRNWDIAVSYYGNHPERYKDQFDYFHACKGSKWQGIADFIANNQDLLSRYRYVWFPDDDLLTTAENINMFFALCDKFGFTVAQPALTPYSYFSWGITLQQEAVDFRITNFVEIMAPCFAMQHFDRFAPSFSYNSSGWGLEWVWLKTANEIAGASMAIVDRTPIHHTRPVGAAAHGGAVNKPLLEMQQLLTQLNIQPNDPVTLKALRLTLPAEAV